MIRRLLPGFLLLMLPAIFSPVSGQRFQNIKQAEDTLVKTLKLINQASDDSLKYALNDAFIRDLSDILTLPSSDIYPFDSLRTLGKITSPDKKFRIFHWNLPATDGKHHYYGFIKILNQVPPVICRLADMSGSLPVPDTMILGSNQWIGALYYTIIPGETATGKKIYTLLGWAGKDKLITQKIIEILTFDEQDRPHFGLKIFPGFKDGNMARVIFRYSAGSSMSLKYEKQPISTNKKWNSRKRIFEYTMVETPIIVCDRMSPLYPEMEGQYQYYVASGDLYDGFIFKNHCWIFQDNIEMRNKK